jgi:hypothetical protein
MIEGNIINLEFDGVETEGEENVEKGSFREKHKRSVSYVDLGKMNNTGKKNHKINVNAVDVDDSKNNEKSRMKKTQNNKEHPLK